MTQTTSIGAGPAGAAENSLFGGESASSTVPGGCITWL
jgi:hypothetical protein